jgi:hypothetical protein
MIEIPIRQARGYTSELGQRGANAEKHHEGAVDIMSEMPDTSAMR